MPKMPEIVFDSSVLSNFSHGNAMPILEKMYSGSATITIFIAAEIRAGIRAGHAGLRQADEAIRKGWLREIDLEPGAEKSLFERFSAPLDLGEASALALAMSRGWTLACDDLAARREAESMRVKLTGTVGILVKAAKTQIMAPENADELLALMIKNGFYAPVKSLKSLLD
jgi:predicted nucleic acid-binding protein